MSAGPPPILKSRPKIGSEGATLVWLDALSSGLCPPKAFLRAMQDQFQGDREGHWEVLSLLDQYYRLGKINAEVFQTVKTQLQDSALGAMDANGANASGAAAPAAVPHTPSAPPPGFTPHIASPPPHAAAEPIRATISRRRPPASALVTAPVDDTPEATPPDSTMSLRNVAVGDVLRERYTLRRVLGEGGMGTVFEATDDFRLDRPANGQRIAIKILHASVAKREELLTELQLEFQHLQSLSHPNIVRVYEVDRDGDIAFFTMELLTGAPLNHVLTARATALPRPYALAIIRDVGAALAYAHAHGVVHGDINPQNIFITNEGELRVLDFGASSKRIPVATAGYASCQVLEGQLPDSRDDLFAFACVVYVLLSGQHPFPTLTSIQARAQRLHPARPAGLTGRQWRVLQEGLRWDREQRPADVQQWLNRFGLEGAASRAPPLPALLKAPSQSKPKSLLVAAAIVLIALLAGIGYWAATDPASLTRTLNAWRTQIGSVLPSAGAPAPRTPKDAGQPEVAGNGRNANEASPAADSSSSATQNPAALVARDAAPVDRDAAPAARDAALAPSSVAPPSPPASPTAAPSTASAPARASVPAHLAAAPAPSGTVAKPATAPAWGPPRIELAADSVDVPVGANSANIVVRRRGSLRGAALFKWWTESGTAKPAKDFNPVTPHEERFPEGSGTLTLSILVSDAPRTQPKSFYVVIDEADSGPALGARTLTMVTLQPAD
jgi:serine/threonine protein kinase